jgi:hypothetical protein
MAGVDPNDVVVGEQVRVSEVLRCPGVRANGAGVGADLGLGEHHSDLHVTSRPRRGRQARVARGERRLAGPYAR